MLITSGPQMNAGSSKPAASFQLVEVTRLKAGSPLNFPIHDDRDVLLLAEGHTITKAFINRLLQRGVTAVKIHESELARICAGEPQGTAKNVPENREGTVCALRTAGTEELDAKVTRGNLNLPPQGIAFANELKTHGAAPYDSQTRARFIERQHQGVGKLRRAFETLSNGRGLDMEELSSVMDDVLADLVQDSDLFTCLGINPFSGDYPARHSLHVCMVAVAIGARLQFDRQTLKELAIGCLVHDAGMLKVDKGTYTAKRLLNPVDFLEITKHPVYAFDMIRDLRGVSHRSALIAYQIHERCNGSGYPRRRVASQIHPLSKIAAVADSYVGIVSPRPHRPAMLPYCAMEFMLKGTQSGLFDPTAVRALLQMLSLFPLGSYVQLSDGRIGRVLRTNCESYTTPVLEVWTGEETSVTPKIVDLRETSDRIVGYLPGLNSAA